MRRGVIVGLGLTARAIANLPRVSKRRREPIERVGLTLTDSRGDVQIVDYALASITTRDASQRTLGRIRLSLRVEVARPTDRELAMVYVDEKIHATGLFIVDVASSLVSGWIELEGEVVDVWLEQVDEVTPPERPEAKIAGRRAIVVAPREKT